MSLSEEERAELAFSLVDSFDEKVDPGAQEAWDQEIARFHELDSGKAKAIPWDEARSRISSKLTHGK